MQPRRSIDAADSNLYDHARACLIALNDLQKTAKNPPGPPRGAKSRTLEYLKEKERKIIELIDLYKVWWDNIGPEPPYNSDKQAVSRATTKLRIQKQKVNNAKEILIDRMNVRRIYLRFASFNEKREQLESQFNAFLLELEAAISDLNSLTKKIRYEPPKKNYKQRSVDTLTRLLIQLEEKGIDPISIVQNDILWEGMNVDPGVRNHVCNSQNPGDGDFYDRPSFHQARTVLEELYQAWIAAFSPSSIKTGRYSYIKGLKDLPNYDEIFVILKHIKFETYFDAFLRYGKYKLPLSREDLSVIVGSRDPSLIPKFFAEQHRVAGRPWPQNPGEIVELDAQEPLPHTNVRYLGTGNFGVAHKVTDYFTKQVMVHKGQKFNIAEIEKHFKDEIKVLTKLLNVKHVVQLKRAYRRNGQYAMLVEYGYESLKAQLLKKCQRTSQQPTHPSKEKARQGSLIDRTIYPDEHFDSVVMNVFGCLWSGLARIHAAQVRHKDIKPENIIYNYNPETGKHDFFFIDFGIAYLFENDVDSHSKPQKRYSTRWAAPEVMVKEPPDLGHSKLAGNEPGLPEEDEVSNVGRKADVYGLGIVGLEVLSVLVGENYDPDDKLPPLRTLQACAPFYLHLRALEDWISKSIQKLDPGGPRSNLIPLFNLCRKMTQLDAEKRPTAKQAALELASMNNEYFCEDCLEHMNELQQLPDDY